MGNMHRVGMVVGSLDCDVLGHMNVARYIDMCSEAGFAMMNAMGWPPGKPRAGRRLSFAAVDIRSRFRSELLSGANVTVSCAVAKIGTRSAQFVYRIEKDDGTPAFDCDWTSALMDLDSRRATEIPGDLRADLERYLVPQGPVGDPAP